MRKHIVWHADNVPKRTTACVDIFRPYVASGAVAAPKDCSAR
jgi:hypothetical protein